MKEIRGFCKNCNRYDKKSSYCSYIGKNTGINDYCSFFESISIIEKPKERQYFYYIQAEGLPRRILRDNSNSALIEHYNYDFSEKAALIRAQEQLIDNKLRKIAEALNGDWKPNCNADRWYLLC